MSTKDFQIAVRLSPDKCCKYCASEHGKIIQAGPHRKLMCGSCGKYLKFVGKDEFDQLMNPAEYSQQLTNLAKYPENLQDEVVESTGFDQAMGEINFKLDLILDHLGIKA